MVGKEALQVMGIPIYTEALGLKSTSAFHAEWDNLTEPELRFLTGNSMFAPLAGSLTMFVLANFERY